MMIAGLVTQEGRRRATGVALVLVLSLALGACGSGSNKPASAGSAD
jgi:hypothetical protein